jgi:hypothetical protein
VNHQPEQAAGPGVAQDTIVTTQLNLLRDQVDLLQIEAAERKKPWYRDVSTRLSIAALAISTVFSGYSVVQSYQQEQAQGVERQRAETKAKLETLRAFLVQVSDIRAEELQEQATVGRSNPTLFAMRSSARNTKRQILLQSADAVAGDLTGSLTPQVLNTLAYEQMNDSRFDSAEKYFPDALAAAGDDVSKIAARSGLATVYATPGSPRQNIDKARAQWSATLALLRSRRDEYARQQRVETMSQFAYAEIVNGNPAAGAALIASAKAEVDMMNAANPVRQSLLARIAMSEQQLRPAGGALLSQSSNDNWTGVWSIRYPQHPEWVGRLHVVSGAQPNMQGAAAEIFEGGVLVKKYAGTVTLDGSNTLRIDWNGVRRQGFTSGVTVLRRTVDALVGEESELGEEKTSVTVRKADS